MRGRETTEAIAVLVDVVVFVHDRACSSSCSCHVPVPRTVVLVLGGHVRKSISSLRKSIGTWRKRIVSSRNAAGRRRKSITSWRKLARYGRKHSFG